MNSTARYRHRPRAALMLVSLVVVMLATMVTPAYAADVTLLPDLEAVAPQDLSVESVGGTNPMLVVRFEGSILNSGAGPLAIEGDPSQDWAVMHDATAGTFSLTIDGQTTAAVAFNASAGAVRPPWRR